MVASLLIKLFLIQMFNQLVPSLLPSSYSSCFSLFTQSPPSQWRSDIKIYPTFYSVANIPSHRVSMSKYAKATNVMRRDSDWKNQNQQRLRKENVFAAQRHIATSIDSIGSETKTFHETFDRRNSKHADLPRFRYLCWSQRFPMLNCFTFCAVFTPQHLNMNTARGRSLNLN